MFTEVEKRFRRYTFILMSAVILLSFATIYVIVYQNVHVEVRNQLEDSAKFMMSRRDFDEEIKQKNAPRNFEDKAPPQGMDKPFREELKGGMPPNGNVFLAIKEGDTYVIDSPLNKEYQEEISYNQIIDKAISHGRFDGEIKVERRRWSYKETAEGNFVFMETTEAFRILAIIAYVGIGMYMLLIFVFMLLSRKLVGKLMEPAKESYRKQEEMIANVSHELKTPLAIMKTNAEVLALRPEKTIGEQQKWLVNIQDEITRATERVSYMLTMSKALPLTVQNTELDLAKSIDTIISKYLPEIHSKAIIVEKHLSQQSIITNVDALQRLLHILIENAVTYTPENGRITIENKKLKHKTFITISNSGHMLEQGEEKKIFDRYYRGNQTSKKNGYGLGLSIAQELAGYLHGKLRVQMTSELITFMIEL